MTRGRDVKSGFCQFFYILKPSCRKNTKRPYIRKGLYVNFNVIFSLRFKYAVKYIVYLLFELDGNKCLLTKVVS